MEKIRESFPLIARVFIGGMFLVAGVQKVTGFDGMVGFAASVGMPAPTLAIALAIAIEIIGGAAVIAGWRIREASLALVVFTVVATAYFHVNFADQTQTVMFMKNLAIIGGLLYMSAFGAGHFSCRSCGNCGNCAVCNKS